MKVIGKSTVHAVNDESNAKFQEKLKAFHDGSSSRDEHESGPIKGLKNSLDERNLDQHLNESYYTRAVKKLGPHKQLDQDLEISLNDKTCQQITNLFSGAITHSNDNQ
ncbi:unnamed protein product [Mucor fragilis]|jgi:hypothetical protein